MILAIKEIEYGPGCTKYQIRVGAEREGKVFEVIYRYDEFNKSFSTQVKGEAGQILIQFVKDHLAQVHLNYGS